MDFLKKAVHRSFIMSLVAIGLLTCPHLCSAGIELVNTRLDPKDNVAEYLSCIAEKGVTLISAHRGGPKPGFPENALESLKAAVNHGPMLLEVDVRETADGQLILLHDASLERTTTGKGNLSDYSLKELQELRLVDNDQRETAFAIPTLLEVLRWADDRAIVQLDVKRGVSYEQVARTVVAADAVDSVVIITYRLEDILTSFNVDNRLSFSYSIDDKSDLQALEDAETPRSQLVAWTGVVDEIEKPVWPVLEALDIPFAAGAFWDLEEKIIKTNNTQPYIALSEAGTDVVGSDYYWLAYDTLDKQQDMANALSACNDK
ncbi:MAG: glycerophosphodiester phosphodiesterase family protein [Pseudomonadota bacterium]